MFGELFKEIFAHHSVHHVDAEDTEKEVAPPAKDKPAKVKVKALPVDDDDDDDFYIGVGSSPSNGLTGVGNFVRTGSGRGPSSL